MTLSPKARRLLRAPFLPPLAALVLVASVFAFLAPSTFARPATFASVAFQTAVVGIAATGATLVVMLGGVDLSAGSGVALTTVIVAALLKSGLGPLPASLIGMLCLAATGALTGAVIARFKALPFLVTLGTMSILRGVAKGLAHEQKIDVDVKGIDALVLPARGVLGLPIAVWILVAVAALVAAMLRFTRFGRHVLAVGSNERTAHLAGLPVNRIKVLVYALAALLTGLAGIVELGSLTVGDPTDSIGLELEVIASVVLGGGSLSGGQGSVLGALFGALLMTTIKTGCQHVGLDNWVQEIVTGSIIVIAALLDGLRQGRSSAR
jgi:ribose transport system permease protein